MFLDKFPKLTQEEVESIQYQGDPIEYDVKLAELASKFNICLVLNPYLENPNWPHLVDHVPDREDQCIVWHYQDQWLAKLFPKNWQPENGYIDIRIPKLQYSWRKNPDIDIAMTFFDSPLGNFEPEPWDKDYTLIWYMDPVFNPTDDEIWVMTCEPIGRKSQGTKHMGYLTPQVLVENNPKLPYLGYRLEEACPAYWDLAYDNAYYLNPSHTKDLDEKLWVIKVTPRYRKTKGWNWLGQVTPDPEIIYNSSVGIVDYDLDLSQTSWDDLRYANVYLLDREYLEEGSEDLWAIKVLWTDEPEGVKVMGYARPVEHIEVNPDIDFIDVDYEQAFNYRPLLKDWDKKIVWELDPQQTDYNRVWAVKKSMRSDSKEFYMENYLPAHLSDHFDVFFISYNETNAEENWSRVQKFAPNAKRIMGIKGIFQAHKAAAEQSESDMFWVVDGDAWLVDDWNFNFTPNLFDRNCTHIWSSINPVNGLRYGHSGVKLFPKSIFDKQIDYLDMTTELNTRIKVIDKISNENRFNTDEFSTWRTAFRECYKLLRKTDKQSKQNLSIWNTKFAHVDYADFALLGYRDAQAYADKNLDINDYDLLKKVFNERRNKKN